MRILAHISAILFVSLLLSSFVFQNDNTGFALTIEVNNLRNSKGVVQFALYNKDKTIPDEDYENYFKIQTAGIVNGSSKITFLNLPAGKYAVNVLHDENQNGKIDKGFIFPIEGIGFSNFQSIRLSNRPNFRKASFDVMEDKSIAIKVIYM